MADRPILFSAPMVRALLDGRKTQTRRIMKPQPNILNGGRPMNNGRGSYSTEAGWKRIRYAVGDRLYVREHWRTWSTSDNLPPRELKIGTAIDYIADDEDVLHGKHRQAMHMPRWASRLTLPVTNVRVERLQDISEADAIAEGISSKRICGVGEVWMHYGNPDAPVGFHDPRQSYQSLWDQINGEGAWDANPWVVAISFNVIKQNIDEVAA